MGITPSSDKPPSPAARPRSKLASEPRASLSRSLQKGQQTRAAILDAALRLSSQRGLEGLSIGVLADAMQMSKSGVFAHFGSREELQISVIREYHNRFEAEVFMPALGEPRGMRRLRAMLDAWLQRMSVELHSGCIYISGAVEFDDCPGPVRDALVDMVRSWHGALHRAIGLAVEEGHLAPDIDPPQLLFELHGLILSVHHDARFLRAPGAIERARVALRGTLDRYTTPAGRALIEPALADALAASQAG